MKGCIKGYRAIINSIDLTLCFEPPIIVFNPIILESNIGIWVDFRQSITLQLEPKVLSQKPYMIGAISI